MGLKRSSAMVANTFLWRVFERKGINGVGEHESGVSIVMDSDEAGRGKV
jgi:hypothetical protein